MQVAFSAFSAAYKCLFCCRRCYRKIVNEEEVRTPPSIRIPVEKLPWFWIGVKLHGSKVMTVTDEVNTFIGDGDRINKEYIAECIGLDARVIQGCYYLDSKTLEEKEFPPEGLTISNDPQ